jgi:hypothetical protein
MKSTTPTDGEPNRAEAAGYEKEKGPTYPYTEEDVRKHAAFVKGLSSEYTDLASSSPSYESPQRSSSSTQPVKTKEQIHTCEHGVKTLNPRKNGKKRNLDEPDEIEARKRVAERLCLEKKNDHFGRHFNRC